LEYFSAAVAPLFCAGYHLKGRPEDRDANKAETSEYIAIMLFLMMAVYASSEDRALIARLQRRDPQALAELYDRYGKMAYSLVLRVVRDNAIAEDLVQETFLRVWNRVHSVDSDKGSIGPWLLAIARNRAIDYLRSSAGRERKAVELDEIEHASLYHQMEAEILVSDQARRVKVAMDKLEPNYRTVMELAYFEGLSQSEMAIKMGQPLGTIKTWVRTALQSLRDDLGVATS
jgi:RNA polymerase sigma-70 factor (ECF subfamily)